MFDLSRQFQPDSVDFWVDDLERKHAGRSLRFFVGSKCDLKSSSNDSSAIRDLCERNGKYFETSSLEGVGVRELFEEIVSQFR